MTIVCIAQAWNLLITRSKQYRSQSLDVYESIWPVCDNPISAPASIWSLSMSAISAPASIWSLATSAISAPASTQLHQARCELDREEAAG